MSMINDRPADGLRGARLRAERCAIEPAAGPAPFAFAQSALPSLAGLSPASSRSQRTRPAMSRTMINLAPAWERKRPSC